MIDLDEQFRLSQLYRRLLEQNSDVYYELFELQSVRMQTKYKLNKVEVFTQEHDSLLFFMTKINKKIQAIKELREQKPVRFLGIFTDRKGFSLIRESTMDNLFGVNHAIPTPKPAYFVCSTDISFEALRNTVTLFRVCKIELLVDSDENSVTKVLTYEESGF